MNFTIRPSRPDDFNCFLRIYNTAREFMSQTGNPTQWGDGWPYPETVADDIARGLSYAVEAEERVCAVFAFIVGEDPTYLKIDGQWLNSEPYGTVHRLASDGTVHGIFPAVVEFCQKICGNIRIDTHQDNLPMRRALEKAGFSFCGTINTRDGSLRLAFQRVFEEK